MALNKFDSVRPILKPFVYGAEPGGQNDQRLWHFLSGQTAEDPQLVIVGFPVDEGVRRNGGRVGASAAPDAIRSLLSKLTPDAGAVERGVGVLRRVLDLGNVVPGNSLEESQERLGLVVSSILSSGAVPIILGGGHETAFGHFLGYADESERPAILNLDAHADVRPLKNGLGHSGSPFRQAASADLGVQSYTVAGLQRSSVSSEQIRFMDESTFRYFWRDEVTSDLLEQVVARLPAPVLATIDMDVVDQAFAPGVSAPATGGISTGELLEYAFMCGRSQNVRSLDLVELCPHHDEGQRTARLAARAVWEFMRGFADRPIT